MRFLRNFIAGVVITAMAVGIVLALLLPPIILVIIEAALLVFLGGIILCR